MKAIYFTEFKGTLSVVDIAIPVPTDAGVVIKVQATGLCRSDWHAWMGHDSDIVLPHVPGHEFAGVISSVGSLVSKFAVGDRVTVPFVCGCGKCTYCLRGDAQVCPTQTQPGFTGFGSFAEYVAIDNADFNLIHIPAEVSFATAAALGCRFATSYRGLIKRAKVKSGETVAIFGCGGVGLAAIMIAKSRGATVVGIDTSNPARDRARLAGADYVLDSIHDDVVEEIKKYAPAGADLTVDALGSIATSKLAVESLRRLGRHVQVGLLPTAEVKDQATVPMHTVIGRELTIMGSHGMSAAHYPEMLAEIASGVLRPDTLVERTITLDEVPDALAQLGTNPLPGITIIKP
mgnify:CR=1 FL=1